LPAQSGLDRKCRAGHRVLATDAARLITGQTIHGDGDYHIID
jgi:hypothetical protein